MCANACVKSISLSAFEKRLWIEDLPVLGFRFRFARVISHSFIILGFGYYCIFGMDRQYDLAGVFTIKNPLLQKNLKPWLSAVRSAAG